MSAKAQSTNKSTKKTKTTTTRQKKNQPSRRTKSKASQATAANGDWWEKGIRFECQGSGQCCVSRGEYGYVWMALADRRRMANELGLSTAAFTRTFCVKTDGIYRLKDGPGPDCVFLVGNRCSVYKGRPDQCRTWPFWPEVMNAKTWKKEVAAFCPGVGKGRLHSAEEIRRNLKVQTESEVNLVRGK